jgi:hypothetical protein
MSDLFHLDRRENGVSRSGAEQATDAGSMRHDVLGGFGLGDDRYSAAGFAQATRVSPGDPA